MLLYCTSAKVGGGRGNVLHHVKREGKLSGDISERICPGEYVWGECPHPAAT